MTINVSISVPDHCAAKVTVSDNYKSDNPTESTQIVAPGASYSNYITDTRSIFVEELTLAQYSEAEVPTMAEAEAQADEAEGLDPADEGL